MKGIIFKPNMIKAIAESDREWQTRRLGGLKEINKEPDKWILYDFHSAHGVVTHTNKPNSKGQFIFWQAPIFDSPDGSYKYIKPRYQVGETVYIKEELLLNPIWGEAGYRDGSPVFIYNDELIKTRHILKWRWRSDVLSSRCMPREAARYFIKITDIRAERLQEITVKDIKAEGVTTKLLKKAFTKTELDDIYRGNFSYLWNSINPKYPWESNPFVFVYSFKKAEK